MAKTVLVTGAGSGIGLASARAFARAGYSVVVTDVDGARATAAARDIGGDAIAAAVDVREAASITAAFDKGCERFGAIDVVHANAGVSNMKRAVDLTEADWDFNMAVNAKGVFLTNQIAVRRFLEHRIGGTIVNTASLAAKRGAPFLAHYSASKFAVLGWTQALALEHAKDGIRINAVCPGFVATSMQDREVEWEAELLGSTPGKVRQSYVDQTPLGRLATAEDVADVVVFLASDAARFMTGQAVNVTGGICMS
jgi:NAD(P)-dependent dehydrogenase (short-subunit alcohol dehydrogenase family)